jgi:fibrillarin-like rRNA methylase
MLRWAGSRKSVKSRTNGRCISGEPVRALNDQVLRFMITVTHRRLNATAIMKRSTKGLSGNNTLYLGSSSGTVRSWMRPPSGRNMRPCRPC